MTRIIPINNTNNVYLSPFVNKQKTAVQNSNKHFNSSLQNLPYSVPISFCAKLQGSDEEKYNFLINFLKDVKITPTSNNLSANKQLQILLQKGILLKKDSNDNTSILDNLYEIATQDRAFDLDKKNLISNVLDTILNPSIITQNFGDIPQEDKKEILSNLPSDDPAKLNPQLLDINSSGTCVAASNEVNLADKYPAEFARWVNKLSSTQQQLNSTINLGSICSNKLEAIQILNLLKADVSHFNFDKFNITIKPDKNAYIRAKNQDKNWDLGERNVADVLIQSAIMSLGSQGTYDSLTDTRAGDLSANPQGLIEIEKTFVESIIKNREIESVAHQQIDDNKKLIGYNDTFENIKNQLIKILDSNEDVILGYVLTNESAGITQSPNYNPQRDGDPNLVINGHEITVVGYRTDKNGETIFICIDTDDDNLNKVEYSASWLIPKINHAGIPVKV